ncbi:MAG TPA: hypothetical protein DD435_03905 [Cyanobacteria bacterium UBA8530]|nr:hypothetical protein [Cyanobacteria bacterium UBA8530]
MKKPFRLTLFIFALIPLSALAAPIGTTPDTRPAAPQERPQWKDNGFSLQLGGNYLKGNVDLFNLISSFSFNANRGQHQFFADASNMAAKNQGSFYMNRASGSALYAYGLRENFNLYAYSTQAFDQAIKLDYRHSYGIGACLHKLAQPNFKLFLLSVALAPENEWYQQGLNKFTVRSMFRANAILPLTANSELGADSFFTPALRDAGDYRLFGEGYWKTGIAENLSFKLSCANEYISRPLPGIRNNDLGVFSSLVFDWGSK